MEARLSFKDDEEEMEERGTRQTDVTNEPTK
jgi:hypothetical protein